MQCGRRNAHARQFTQHAAESRYHPIEGELLGVTWALEKKDITR